MSKAIKKVAKQFFHVLYCDEGIHEEAHYLTYKRMEEYGWIENHKYGWSNYNSNFVGSMGEFGLFKLLKKNGIKSEKLYEKSEKETDNGDLRVGETYIEIKTRSVNSFKVFGNRIHEKQVAKFRKTNKTYIIVWVCFDKYTDQLYISGWNKLADMNIKFTCAKTGDKMLKSMVLRDDSSLFKMFIDGKKAKQEKQTKKEKIKTENCLPRE